MRHWKIVVIACFAIMMVAFSCLILYPGGNRGKVSESEPEFSKTGIEEPEIVPETGIQEQMSEWLAGFAETVYEYDTNERKFYVGAQDYMTESAFRAFAPLEGEGGDAEPQEVRVQSRLLETKDYYYFVDDFHAEVIMESRFTLSAGGNGSLIQYLKLTVEKKNDAWLITECNVIDTLEQ